MSPRRVVSLLLSSVVVALGLPAQQLVYAVEQPPTRSVGSAFAELDDVDGDGVADFASGSPTAYVTGARDGLVEVRSGVNGDVLLSFAGLGTGQMFGSGLHTVADIDGDGRRDLAVESQGRLTLYSGQAFGMLMDFDPPGPTPSIGRGDFGDFDGDNVSDFVVGLNNEFHVIAGLNPVPFLKLPMGGSIAPADDITGDGVPELAHALEGFCGYPSCVDGLVEVLDGTDGSVVWSATRQGIEEFGEVLVDGGRPEHRRLPRLHGLPRATSDRGRVRIRRLDHPAHAAAADCRLLLATHGLRRRQQRWRARLVRPVEHGLQQLRLPHPLGCRRDAGAAHCAAAAVRSDGACGTAHDAAGLLAGGKGAALRGRSRSSAGPGQRRVDLHLWWHDGGWRLRPRSGVVARVHRAPAVRGVVGPDRG